MPYAKTKEGSLVNEVTLGDGYPLSNDLQPLKIGGEASILGISSPLPDGSDSGLFRVDGDLDITGTLKTKLSHDLIYDFDDEVNTLAQVKIDALIDSAPAALDTLNELAAALGDDASFATTITNSIALKAPLAAPAFTGNATFAGVTDFNSRVDINHTAFPQLSFSDDSGTDILNMGQSGEVFYFKTSDTNNDIRFRRSDNEDLLKLDMSALRVGIGTTSPDVDLDIRGTNPSIILADNSPSDNKFIAFNIDVPSDDVHTISVDQADSLAFGEKLEANDTSLENEWVRITNTGNVGIGTTSPSTPLHINKVITNNADNSLLTIQGDRDTGDLGTEKVLIDFTMTDSNANNFPQVKIGAAVGQNADADSIPKEGSGAFVVYTSGGDSSVDGEDNTAERMRVDYQGNVGIGTTSPDVALEINGGAGTDLDPLLRINKDVDGDGSATGILIGAVAAGYSKSGIFFENKGIGNGKGNLYFCNDNTGDTSDATIADARMTITNTGNVGIGTTSPSVLTHISADGSSTLPTFGAETRLAVTQTGNTGGYNAMTVLGGHATGASIYKFGDKDDEDVGKFIYYHEHNRLDTFVNGSQAMSIDSSQNVGIGTTSPSTELEVDGDITANELILSGTSAGISINSDSDTEIFFNTTNNANIKSQGSMYLLAAASQKLYLGANNTNAQVALDNGKLGIGIASPTTTLDVDGTVSYKHTAFTTAGPTDNVDVSDTTVLEVDTSGGSVTIGGFTGGVQGQILYVIKTTSDVYTLKLENSEGGGSQDIFSSTNSDISLVRIRGGVTLYCNGTSWFVLNK